MSLPATGGSLQPLEDHNPPERRFPAGFALVLVLCVIAVLSVIAVTLIREIRQKIHCIGEQPLVYQLRPEIGEGARLAVVGRYVILFRVLDEAVRIERVIYGGRDLPPLLQ